MFRVGAIVWVLVDGRLMKLEYCVPALYPTFPCRLVEYPNVDTVIIPGRIVPGCGVTAYDCESFHSSSFYARGKRQGLEDRSSPKPFVYLSLA